MNGVLLRHQQPGGLGRAPRKPMPRGASRLVAKEPLSVRLPKADFSFLKYLAWPLLLAVLGYGAYRGAEYILPYADRPIAKVSVEGDLSYISQRAVQQRISRTWRRASSPSTWRACAGNWNRCPGSPTQRCAGCGRTRW